MGNYLLISDAAKEVKVESHVLRYWEDELHLPIKRNELGHRYYTEEDVERFKQIKGMKERGLQLKAIKMILKDGKLDVLSTGDSEGRGAAGYSGEGCYANAGYENGAGWKHTPGEEHGSDRNHAEGQLAIDIIPNKNSQITKESREDKSRRLQWLLQQLIRQTLQENNGQLCREIRESVVKELDYQFRMQEEREENRDKMLAQRDEEHFKRMDELLRKKTRRLGRGKPESGKAKENKAEEREKAEPELSGEEGKEEPQKKKRRFF